MGREAVGGRCAWPGQKGGGAGRLDFGGMVRSARGKPSQDGMNCGEGECGQDSA